MYKINMQFRSECRQCSVCGIKQGICGNIIRRSDPFALEYTPKSLCNIQMRTVRRQEKEKKTAFLPYRSELCKYSSSMDACIVKNHKGVFVIIIDNLSRKSATFSAVMLSSVVKPS